MTSEVSGKVGAVQLAIVRRLSAPMYAAYCEQDVIPAKNTRRFFPLAWAWRATARRRSDARWLQSIPLPLFPQMLIQATGVPFNLPWR